MYFFRVLEFTKPMVNESIMLKYPLLLNVVIFLKGLSFLHMVAILFVDMETGAGRKFSICFTQ